MRQIWRAFSSNMPDRYIEHKGIIFDRIAEKVDTNQVAKLQKENRQLMAKVEALEVADSTLLSHHPTLSFSPFSSFIFLFNGS